MLRHDEPAPAPVYPARSRVRSGGIGLDTAPAGTVPVLAPSPHVAVHIVKTPGIGFFRPTEWVCFSDFPAYQPRSSMPPTSKNRPVRRLGTRIPIPPRSAGGIRSPPAAGRRAFPGVERPAESLGVVPRHVLHRGVPSLVLEVARVGAHQRLPLALGHVVFSQPIPLGDAHVATGP